MTDAEPGRRRRRWLSALVVVGAVAVAAAGLTVLLGPRVRSPEQAVADAAPPPASLVTARVERRVLMETVILRGTVLPAASIKLLAPAGLTSPTAVVTAVRAKPGATLVEGAVIVEVAGAPVFGLALPFPLYRDLTDGLSGPDVREVQRALSRLGYRTPVDGVFGAGTQEALRRFYGGRGYQVPQQKAEAVPQVSPPTGSPPPAQPPDRPMLPRGNVIRLDQPGRMISAVPVGVGAVLSDPETVLAELDAGSTTISSIATQEQVALLTPGTAAEIVDEVRGLTSTASVEAVGAEPQQSERGAGFEVRLVFTGTALTPTPNHTVRVTVGAAKGSEAVLAVPITAVYSRPDGSTFVTVAAEDDRTAGLTVRTGRSAGGWVEVSPQGGALDVGSRVVVGSDFRTGKPGVGSTPGG